jgi:hypothetical protein
MIESPMSQKNRLHLTYQRNLVQSGGMEFTLRRKAVSMRTQYRPGASAPLGDFFIFTNTPGLSTKMDSPFFISWIAFMFNHIVVERIANPLYLSLPVLQGEPKSR